MPKQRASTPFQRRASSRTRRSPRGFTPETYRGEVSKHAMHSAFPSPHEASDTLNFVNVKIKSEGDVTATQKTHPCTICRKEGSATSYQCDGMNPSIMQAFHSCLEIYRDPSQLTEAANMSLPFCQICRDKVVMLYTHHTQFQISRRLLATIRNDLAFTVINSQTSANESVQRGPLEAVRGQIIERWTPEFLQESNHRHKFTNKH